MCNWNVDCTGLTEAQCEAACLARGSLCELCSTHLLFWIFFFNPKPGFPTCSATPLVSKLIYGVAAGVCEVLPYDEARCALGYCSVDDTITDAVACAAAGKCDFNCATCDTKAGCEAYSVRVLERKQPQGR